ncbi:MAG: endolytic transglycosylase MltG [Defluviitaleaceae bacterium]|nr:endolytic transglycosylase MltG [Defluviitaleaceae bacterium]MCL2263568.1 endolytic transglycosylase MltG [Defluviitaleaceae bacterium]
MKADKTVNFLMYIAGMTFNLVIMVLVGFMVLAAFTWGFEFGSDFADVMVADGENYEFEFHIPHDSSTAEIAQRLEDYGIIPSRFLFHVELFLRGISNDYTAGTYTLNLNMNNVEINRALRARPHEVAPHYEIRIPEGWTIRDMAAYFEERGFFSAEEFIYVAQYGHFSFAFLQDVPTGRPNRLEGYLFPDTYQIPINPNPGDIITRMLHNFDGRFNDELHARAEEMNLTTDQVIIMASIIERETRLASERPLVSQVIHRRLAQNIRLQMCSTVRYVHQISNMEDPPVHLLYVHLEVDSPYNTYRHAGLPIGPISNPGEAAIRAALWPSDTNYLFFVLRDENTGEHYFSRTEAEHNAARDRYIRNVS